MGRGSWSAAFRRPQFKQANTVIASPASKSTARSGNIAPWHLSHVFMGWTLPFLFNEAYPPEVLDRRMNEFPYLPSPDGPFGPVIFFLPARAKTSRSLDRSYPLP